MKLGIIIKQGTEKEVSVEFNKLLEKAKAGYGELVCVLNNKTFKIETEGVKVTFIVDALFKDDYAVYQIFE